MNCIFYSGVVMKYNQISQNIDTTGHCTITTDLLKAQAILSDTTVRRSAVDCNDLKPYRKSEKRPHFSR